MANSGTRDRRRERASDPTNYRASAGRDNCRQKDSAAKRCGERKASGLVTTHGKGQQKRSEGRTRARRRGDEEKEKAGEGCKKERPPTQRFCRAFSDVVERSETIGTERKRRRRRYVWGWHQAGHDAREVATEQEEERVRHGPNVERTDAREREARKTKERRPPTPWSVEPFGRWLRGTKPSAQKKKKAPKIPWRLVGQEGKEKQQSGNAESVTERGCAWSTSRGGVCVRVSRAHDGIQEHANICHNTATCETISQHRRSTPLRLCFWMMQECIRDRLWHKHLIFLKYFLQTWPKKSWPSLLTVLRPLCRGDQGLGNESLEDSPFRGE